MKGETWKMNRRILSPTFSISKVKTVSISIDLSPRSHAVLIRGRYSINKTQYASKVPITPVIF